MRNIAVLFTAIGTVMLASAIWGWWGFGIALTVAVVIASIVISNRAPAPAAGANQQAQPARGGRQPDRWVQVLENIGGLVSLVVFAGLAIAVIGLVQECGSGVSAELARLHEVYPGNEKPTAQQPTPTTAQQNTASPLTFAKIPGNQEIKIALDASEATVWPAGTEILIRAEGCGTWKYRALNKEQEQYMLQHPDFHVKWNERTDAEADFQLVRQSWVEVTTEKDCKVGIRVVMLGTTS
ncbi:MAG: hypothetical protein V1902_03140 [Candidatus Falkowbacteria bacterium]